MSQPERFPHGTRSRYTSGCRCDPCREANRLYARQRAKAIIFHGKDELVSTEAARFHIRQLSKQGIGKRTVADASGVARSIIHEIRQGKRLHIRRSTERRILAVDASCRADHSYVSAKRARQQVDLLLNEGFTEAQLAQQLGKEAPRLRLNLKGKIIAINASRVERLFQYHIAEGEL